MINRIKLFTTVSVISLLSACGGGGGGGVAVVPSPITPQPPVVVDPKITVYSTFDLSNSVLTGNSSSDGVLQGCSLFSNSAATQINLVSYKFAQDLKTIVKKAPTLWRFL